MAAALSRLSRPGVLKRYAKSHYYRPQTSRFGALQPFEAAILRTLTAGEGTVSAYPVGPALYNQLGLTTQVPAEVVISSPKRRRTRPPRVAFVVRPAPEQASDVPLLQWLELLCDLRRMPDAWSDKVLYRGQRLVKALFPAQRRRLTELAARQRGAVVPGGP